MWAYGRKTASQLYVASVALSEFLHLSYVSDEMGWSIGLPLQIIQVNNAAAIAFRGGRPRSRLRVVTWSSADSLARYEQTKGQVWIDLID